VDTNIFILITTYSFGFFLFLKTWSIIANVWFGAGDDCTRAMLLVPSMRHDPWILGPSYGSFALKMLLTSFRKLEMVAGVVVSVSAIKIKVLL